jgi:hypothetical protein
MIPMQGQFTLVLRWIPGRERSEARARRGVFSERVGLDTGNRAFTLAF